jgi:phosphatidylglycerol:prolipoprotein diacylglycerol transferase
MHGDASTLEAAAHGYQPAYVIPVILGLLLTVLFPASRTFASPRQRSIYRILQIATLIGAIVGAKLTAVVIDLHWPFSPLPEGALFRTGRTLTGGLLFGFLTAEILKPIVGHVEPPNDRFAMVLPFSIAIGRVGCLLSGCCGGIAWDGPWAMADVDGVLRHPTALYDLAFHVGLGALFVFFFRTGRQKNRLFAIHLIAYGVFRFLVEELRVSPIYALGLTGYQLVSILLVLAGLFSLWRYGAATAPLTAARVDSGGAAGVESPR